MKTLYISDLDGTLLGADSRVSPRSERLLTSLPPDKLFTIATARTPATVDRIIPPAIGPHIPAIVITGAALWHRDSHRYSDVRVMDTASAAAAEAVMLDEGMAPFTYTIDAEGGMLYTYGRIPDGRPRLAPLTRAESRFVDERRDLPLKKIVMTPNPGLWPPLLVFGIGDRAGVERAAARVAARIDCSVSVYSDVFNPDKGFVEVFAPGVSKGAAAIALKERLGCGRMVAFGDSLNDLAMMRVADTAVAVANGAEALRDAADVVTGQNTEDAVARYIVDDPA